MAIQKITADVISSDAITTASISDSAITAAKLAGTLDLTGKTITIATASSGDNDTSPASTAFVQQEISALVDSSPDALNTLNELAAALGDDANFSTTVTNSIALKAPLASPQFTGNAEIGSIETSTNFPLIVKSGTNDHAIAIEEASGAETWQLGVDSAGSLRFYNSGATSSTVVFNDAGNIGIGIQSPSHILDVESDKDTWISKIYNTGSDANAQGLLVRSDATAAHDASVMGVYADGGYKMIVKSSGNVGIGTDSPTNAKLQVQGDGVGIKLDGTANTTRTIFFRNTTSSNPAQIYSDGSLRLYTEDAGTDIRFHTVSNGTNNERLRIDASGNVGIGTDSPSAPLDLAGNFIFKSPANTLYGNFDTTTQAYGAFRLQAAGSNYGFIGQTSSILASGGSNTALGLRSENEFAIATGGSTERMRIDSSGNVGIGNTDPGGMHSAANKLVVGTGSGDQGMSVFAGTSQGRYAFARALGNNTDAYDGGMSYDGNRNLTFHTNAGTERVRIDGAGKVGIGVLGSLSNILQIKSTASGGPQIQIGDGTNYGFINFDGTSMQISTQRDMVDGTWYNTSKSWGGINIVGESIGSKITMATAGNSNTAPTTHFLLDRDGHLILGSSTTEAGKLSVYTDATNDSAIYGYRSTSYFRIVPFLSNGAYSSLSNVNDSGLFFSDNFVIAKAASGNYGMIVAGSGNIHIGTETEANGSTGGATFSADSSDRRNLILATTATGSLELIEFRNPNGTVGTIKTSGTSTSYNTSSDYRLKENVDYDFNALDRVTQLKPARFNFMTDADTVLDGFLAHEVSSIVPEAVSGEKDATKEEEYEVTPAQYEDDGETLISEAVMGTRIVPVYQGIDQSKLVPLLTKAIQEQQTIIESLTARIETLEG